MRGAVWVLVFWPLSLWAQEKWEKEWNQAASGAKKEGRVVVSGPPDSPVRQNVPAKFTAKFGIPVEYIGVRPSEVVARMKNERQAGLYTVDVFLGAIQTMAQELYPEKMLDPVKPVLILPEVLDPSKWKRGKLWFLDPEGSYVLRLFETRYPLFYINTRFVKPEDLKSVKDLLDPKWRGKISGFDPTQQGKGIFTATQLYAQFGEEFVKQLYVDQKPGLSREDRQITDWLLRGIYPISLDANSQDVEKMQKEGFPVIAVFNLAEVPGRLSSAHGHVALVNRAPHANAAKIFVNWIASKEGLEIYAQAKLAAPTRNDIDESFLPPEYIPRPGVSYFDNDAWDFVVGENPRVRKRLKEILGR